ncbi:MAG: formylglycine-generating enzyme family protein [Bacteroidia bacterium]
MTPRSLVYGLGLLGCVWANALEITNVSVDWANKTVTFTIQWQNAWRVNFPPNNWDAAWVFVKFRQCNALADPWTHGLISTVLGDHTFPSGIEPVLSDGTASGIDPAPNNTGVMLRPQNTGTFATFGPYTVTLKVTNLPTSGSYDLKVLGIEMVFIPEGSYTLGTLSGWYSYSGEAAYAFDQNGNSNNPHVPYTITSENPITLKWAGSGSSSVNLPAGFPKGYKAIHCMKYEISQGQYAMFLNTLPSTVTGARYPGTFGTDRNQLASSGAYPNVYYSDRPDRAQNYLSWEDVTSYLDWACLRPMTELEFEKICRGPGASVGEYAWGTMNITPGTNLSISPENGTEVFTNANANATYNNVTYTGGDGGKGPVRVGIHAKSTSPSREASGASYYGVLDMSGNVWERCISVHTGSAFDGQLGDGYVDAATGLADVANWPLTGAKPFAYRGGSWYEQWYELRVSQRSFLGGSSNYFATNRDNDAGGRGVR